MKKYKHIILSLLLSFFSIFLVLLVMEIYLRSTTRYGKHVDHNAEPRVHRSVFFEPKSKKRIVIIGDSMTFGDGIVLADTYPFKLQEKLDKRYPKSFEVINMGIMGSDTDFHAEVLITGKPEVINGKQFFWGRSGFSLDPDVVILTFYANDIELLGATERRPKDYILFSENNHIYLKKHFSLYSLLHNRINNLRVKMGLQLSYAQHLQNIYSKESPEWVMFEKLLNFIIFNVKVRNQKMLLVLYSHAGPDDSLFDLYQKVEAIGVKNNINTLNLYPHFEGIDSPLSVSDFNGHPNGTANEIVAKAIYNKLLKEGML